ncbi:hypothetical protein Y032_0062g3338 [Ancylostoma ceylanicum]|nr:hypothetical protein Y032_0062g3338 [Ancylostoma ceylanicum]
MHAAKELYKSSSRNDEYFVNKLFTCPTCTLGIEEGSFCVVACWLKVGRYRAAKMGASIPISLKSIRVQAAMRPQLMEVIIPCVLFTFVMCSLSILRIGPQLRVEDFGCAASNLICELNAFEYKQTVGSHVPNAARIKDFISMVIECHCSDTLDTLYQDVLKESCNSSFDNSLALARAQAEIMGDLFLNVAVLQTVISLLNSGVKVLFFYDFDFFNPNSWGPSLKLHFKEAAHTTDMAYVFGIGINYDFIFTPDDIKMLHQTTTLWTNFAKYG